MTNSPKMSLPKTVLMLSLVGIALLIGGTLLGKAFFWNQYEQTKPIDKDIKYLEHAAELKQNQANSGLLVQLGWAYYQKGDYTTAVSTLNKAVTANKLDPIAHFNLGLTYQALKQLAQAEEEFRKSLELEPKSKYGYFALGKLYFDQGDYTEAVSQFKLAVKYNSVNADNFYWLGLAYEKLGKKEEARSAYQKVLNMVPEHTQAKEAYYRLP